MFGELFIHHFIYHYLTLFDFDFCGMKSFFIIKIILIILRIKKFWKKKKVVLLAKKRCTRQNYQQTTEAYIITCYMHLMFGPSWKMHVINTINQFFGWDLNDIFVTVLSSRFKCNCCNAWICQTSAVLWSALMSVC